MSEATLHKRDLVKHSRTAADIWIPAVTDCYAGRGDDSLVIEKGTKKR